MRLDQFLVTVHILAAATWIGVALALQVIARRMDVSTDPAVTDRFAQDAETIGKTLLGPAAAMLMVSGVILVAHEHLGWTRAWILTGLVAVAIAGAVGGTFLIPEGRRIAELARTPGHDPDEVRRRAARRFLIARVDLVVLIVGVADMVFRPGR